MQNKAEAMEKEKKTQEPTDAKPAMASSDDLINAIAENVDWNEEIIEDVSPEEESDLVVYSRDWTIATIISQIEQKNIDLNPKFQRRNAWDDSRRSKLIESLVAGLPVPEIVLAEDPTSDHKPFLHQ